VGGYSVDGHYYIGTAILELSLNILFEKLSTKLHLIVNKVNFVKTFI